VDLLAILDVEAPMYIDQITKLHLQVVVSNLVDLDLPFLNII
jgi:hypothetical protein